MSEKSFPLLRLPCVVQGGVFVHSDPRALIDLSMMSSRFMRSLNARKIFFEFMHVILRDDYIGVKIGNGTEKILEFECFYPAEPFAEAEWKIRRVNGEDVMQMTSGFSWQRLLKAPKNTIESKIELLEKLVSHLLKITIIEKFRLSCKREMDFAKCFFWEVAKTLDFLEIVPTAGQSIRMTSEDMKFVLEGFSIDNIYLRVACFDDKFQFRGPFKNRMVVIDDSRWVDFRNLSIDPDTEHIEFYIKGHIDEMSISRLIQEWIDGKCPKLGRMHFRWLPEIRVNPFPAENDLTYDTWTHELGRSYELISLERILEGLNETNPNEHQLENHNQENTRNVTRKTDGHTGTILQDNRNRKISLLVRRRFEWKK